MAIALGSYGHLQPANLLQGTFYNPDTNLAGFTQLVNQVLAATDPAKQRLLYTQWNQYFLDKSWLLPVTQNPPHLAARPTVRGQRYDALDALVLSEVWLA